HSVCRVFPRSIDESLGYFPVLEECVIPPEHSFEHIVAAYGVAIGQLELSLHTYERASGNAYAAFLNIKGEFENFLNANYRKENAFEFESLWIEYLKHRWGLEDEEISASIAPRGSDALQVMHRLGDVGGQLHNQIMDLGTGTQDLFSMLII